MNWIGENNSLVAIVLMAVALAIFWRYTQRATRASAQRLRHLSKAPDAVTLARELETPASVSRWEVQMHDLARDLTGELDTKIAIVTQLLQTAEERIGQLERAISAAEKLQGDPAFCQLPAHGNSPPRAPADADAQRQEIFSLADAGHTSADIAKRVGSPPGEIELILSLRGKR